MSELTLLAESGRTTGSRSSGRLRGGGRVPAVVYGQGIAPLSVSIDRKDLRAALRTEAGFNALINLEVGGDQHLTIVKDLQRHPVRLDVVHVDFLVVDRDEIVAVEAPITVIGESLAVRAASGTVDQQLFSLTVNAKPADIPNEIVVDISELEIGGSIRVSDLPLPSGVTTDVDPDEAVVIAQVTRASIEGEELDEEAAAAAEGADSPEAAGASKAADAAKDAATEQAGSAEDTTP